MILRNLNPWLASEDQLKKNSLKETEVIWLSLFPGQVIKNEKKNEKNEKIMT